MGSNLEMMIVYDIVEWDPETEEPEDKPFNMTLSVATMHPITDDAGTITDFREDEWPLHPTEKRHIEFEDRTSAIEFMMEFHSNAEPMCILQSVLPEGKALQ